MKIYLKKNEPPPPPPVTVVIELKREEAEELTELCMAAYIDITTETLMVPGAKHLHPNTLKKSSFGDHPWKFKRLIDALCSRLIDTMP